VLSSALVPEKAKEDILCYAEKGQKRFEAFVEDRLLQSSKHSLWDAMKKLTGHFVRQWIISALLQQHNHQAGHGLQ